MGAFPWLSEEGDKENKETQEDPSRTVQYQAVGILW